MISTEGLIFCIVEHKSEDDTSLKYDVTIDVLLFTAVAVDNTSPSL